MGIVFLNKSHFSCATNATPHTIMPQHTGNLILKTVVVCFAILTVVTGILVFSAYDLLTNLENSDTTSEFYLLVLGVYYVFFGVLMTLLEFVFPVFIKRFIRFYAHWTGKGVWYLYLGTNMLAITPVTVKSYNICFWINSLGLIGLGFACIAASFFLPRPSSYLKDDAEDDE